MHYPPAKQSSEQAGTRPVTALAEDEPDLAATSGSFLERQGFRVLHADEGSVIPVIVVTGRSGEADRVAGLELGADDRVVKPSFQRELAARIRAPLRRMWHSAAPGAIHIGEPLVDVAAREIRAAGRWVAFTPLEYAATASTGKQPGQ